MHFRSRFFLMILDVLKNRIAIIHRLSYRLLYTFIKYLETVVITSTNLSRCFVNSQQRRTHPPGIGQAFARFFLKVANVPPREAADPYKTSLGGLENIY